MTFRYGDFPVNDKPLYRYRIAPDGSLLVSAYTHYEVYEDKRGQLQYRIHTGAGITTKREDQLGIQLNNSVYLLDYDPDRALAAMVRHYSDKAEIARISLRDAEAMLEILSKKPKPRNDPSQDARDRADDGTEGGMDDA